MTNSVLALKPMRPIIRSKKEKNTVAPDSPLFIKRKTIPTSIPKTSGLFAVTNLYFIYYSSIHN